MNRKGAGVAWVEIFFFPPHRHPLGWACLVAIFMMHLSPSRLMVDRCTPRDKFARTHTPLRNTLCPSSDDSVVSPVGSFLVLSKPPANSLRSQPARGLASLTRVGGHTLQRQILLGGDCCRHPSDPRFGHATTSFLRAQRTMINPTPRLYQ